MKKVFFPLFFLFLSSTSWGAAPVVTNVFVQQRSGTKLVDINYTLVLDSNVTATVAMWFSSDNGANYSIKLESVTGDVGSGIGSGSKSVVWDAGVDWDNRFTNDGKIRVIARKGELEPDLNSTLGQGSNSVPIITWDKSFGSAGDVGATGIVVTEDGIVIAGSSDSNASGDKSENSKGGSDYWIVKIDADGNKIWDKTIGSVGDDFCRTITATSEGAIVIAGTSNSNASGDKSENSKGGGDYWIVKIDADGNKIWDKTIGSVGNEFYPSITATSEGAIVIAGTSESNAIGDKSENSKGGDDHWIVKIDADGNKIWDKTIGSVGDDRWPRITATSEGAIVIAGTSDSNASGDKSENSKGGNDYWIVKIDADGNKIWDKTIGSVGDDRYPRITATSEGAIVIAGTSNSNASGDKSENSKGGSDYWIVKIDADGNKIWDKTIGSVGNDSNLASIVETNEGGFVVAGGSWSNAGGDKSENSKGGSDHWIVKIDADGNKIWDKTIGTNSEDINLFTTFLSSWGVGIDSLDNIYMYNSGFQFGPTTSGDKTSSPKGGLDIWVIKLSAN